jgi:ABC-2 type transport system ATP-binding protein
MTIELKRVSKAFGDRQVLQDLSFSVAAGEVYGLVGANGAGKTTAINILCGLLEADDGGATVGGRSILGNRHAIGVVPQEISVYGHLTCRENLSLFAALYGFGRQQAAERIEEVLGQLQLGTRARYRRSCPGQQTSPRPGPPRTRLG